MFPSISDTLCYCDEFCDRGTGGDCCPDYRSFCHSEPDPIVSCLHNGVYFNTFNTTRDNCNECRCLEGGRVECETDLCLTDDALIHNVNSIHNLGWSARKYSEWWGRKYSEGLVKRLGTKEPTFRVKAMTRLHNIADGLPRSFNAVDKWSSYISDVPDQGKVKSKNVYLRALFQFLNFIRLVWFLLGYLYHLSGFRSLCYSKSG